MSVRSALNADQPGQRTSRSLGANEVRKVLADYDWPQADYVVGAGKWKVYTHDCLDYMAVWVDTEANRIAISNDTWETLAYEETALRQFFRDMTGGAAGMKFIVADVGPYALAIRKQAQEQGHAAVMPEADPVARLESAATSLVQTVVSMNKRPTHLQQTIFAEKYAGLREELATLQQRLDIAAAALDLAGTALVDATQ